jgi:hypothetical protein
MGFGGVSGAVLKSLGLLLLFLPQTFQPVPKSLGNLVLLLCCSGERLEGYSSFIILSLAIRAERGHFL